MEVSEEEHRRKTEEGSKRRRAQREDRKGMYQKKGTEGRQRRELKKKSTAVGFDVQLSTPSGVSGALCLTSPTRNEKHRKNTPTRN